MTAKLVPVEIGILEITDLGFSINRKSKPSKVFSINFNVEFHFDAKENWIEFIVIPTYSNKDTNEVAFHGSVLTKFVVKDLLNFMEGDLLKLPEGALVTLYSMAYTHTRAIMSKNLKGTLFQNQLLPIIDPDHMLKNLFPQYREVADEKSNLPVI